MARIPSSTERRRKPPRISANELARYMVAGETGRVGIIRNARDQSTPSRIRYATVRQEIRSYFCNTARTERTLNAIRSRFEQKAGDAALSTWDREDARLSLDVLAALARLNNQIGGIQFIPAPQVQPKLMMGGVVVSVNLDVMITRIRGAHDETGGVLFRMTKADDETDAAAQKRRDMGAYAATLAFLQTEANPAAGMQPHHQICASLDVQCEEVHFAPRAYVARAKNMENACRFIAAMWDTA